MLIKISDAQVMRKLFIMDVFNVMKPKILERIILVDILTFIFKKSNISILLIFNFKQDNYFNSLIIILIKFIKYFEKSLILTILLKL